MRDHIGSHLCHVEGDILFLAYRGIVTPEHARGIMMVVGELRRRVGYSLVLSDSREPSTMPHETRRAFLDATTPEVRMDYLAVFGMSSAQQMLATLIARGAKLLGVADVEMAFFDTETAARRFLDEKRKLELARQKSSA